MAGRREKNRRISSNMAEATCQSAATGFSASAAVGSGENLGNLVDFRIFDNFEFLCHKVQHDCENQPHRTKHHNCCNNKITHIFSCYFLCEIICKNTIFLPILSPFVVIFCTVVCYIFFNILKM